MNPEYVEPLRESLHAAGALDCAVWPTQGKKGRVSLRIEALAPPARAAGVMDALFRHSTTGGIRRFSAMRSTLQREEVKVSLEGLGVVRLKVLLGPQGPRVKPEYADVLEIAGKTGRPALEVSRLAQREGETILAQKGYKLV